MSKSYGHKKDRRNVNGDLYRDGLGTCTDGYNNKRNDKNRRKEYKAKRSAKKKWSDW